MMVHTDHSSGVAASSEILHLCPSEIVQTACVVGPAPASLVPPYSFRLPVPSSPRKVSLCDDYSLPVDFVNKRRPVSAAAATSTVQWALPSPTVENAEVEVVEQYSDPRDSKSKAYVEPGAESSLPTIYSKVNRNYCRPYTDPSASGSSCEDDEEGQKRSIRQRKNSLYASSSLRAASVDRDKDVASSTDGAVVDCLASLVVHITDQSPTESNQPTRHPSPYYYGDLFKIPEQIRKSQPISKYRKSVSLDVPGERSRTPGIPKRNSVAGDGGSYSSQQLHPPLQQQQQQPQLQQQQQQQQQQQLQPTQLQQYQSQDLVSPTSGSEHAVPVRNEILSSCIITEWDHTLMPPHRLLSHDLPATVCTCVASPEEEEDELDQRQPQLTRHQVRKLRRTRRIDPQPILVEDEDDVEGEDEGEEEEEEDADLEEDEEEMARQRHLYETAFDCKVNRSDDDLDDLDRVSNHPVLHSQMRSNSAIPVSRTSSSTDTSKQQPAPQQAAYAGQSHSSKDRRKVVLLRPKPIPSRLQQQQQQQQQQQSDNISTLSQDIESLQINSSDEKTGSPRLPARGYTPSPPSTAPLPAKFHGNRDHLLLNIRSTPNLPSQPDHPRLKDLRLPVKSLLRAKDSPQSSEGSILEIKSRPKNFAQDTVESSQGRRFDKELILEFKGRPREDRQRPRSLIRESKPIMEFKGRPHEAESDLLRPRRDVGLLEFKLRTSRRRPGYSSTESMATSSSGGSMESLRSSTSEGNRSTSSSESRHSTSLSSHSSDSGSTNYYHHHHPQPSMTGFLTNHANKLHILSPISDKSSQEPASETSDNNRNNNSQKASPEENVTTENNVTASNNTNTNTNTANTNTNSVGSPMDTSFKKRRAPQNKNLINLALQSSSSGDAEIQGSDSGISIESRAGIKCKSFGFHLLKPQLDNINLVDNEPELSDLPFDMPKLRRRRLLMQQDATTSGSATSVDLRDLPFDMPKLRRRLRCMQSTESSGSQASSSLSVRDVEPPPLFGGGLARPKMTLNLDAGNGTSSAGGAGQIAPKKPGGLSLGLPLEISAARGSADLVDVDLPLERQGWYHGSITRIEAEAVLRLLREGSYLVRNSESTKQDYSLSLKSARGFMHMRIQKNEELNAYILGQFSKPFDSIPEMVRHFSVNRLPIRGAEHMCLLHPVIAQLL
ncbi:SH2 domain-containing adapter heavyweight [Augochlora pura]